MKSRSLKKRLATFTVALACIASLTSASTRIASAQRGYQPAQRGGGIDRRAEAQAETYTGDRFGYVTETPRGAHVAAVRRPSTEMLRAIDDGLTDLFAVARRNGYRSYLNYSDYTVFIARADRTKDSTGAYSPDIAVGAAQYAGSIYDKGGYVYAAGIVSSYEPGAFAIAEHERDWQRVANVVRYEGEHIVLYHNDRQRFLATRDHSHGGSHPILK
ncbi:MAG: hypothetical protein QOE33_1487 [Acidobacteriota bacterium]|nr:hypothetical protein [Acidobacteriota bacterium]